MIAICITCYNKEAYIAEAIESALAQTHSRTKVVVCDDGSTDKSWEIINTFSKITTFRQENAGTAAARNTCIQLSNSPFSIVKAYQFLDGDDVLYPECVAERVEVLKSNPKIGIVYSDFENSNGHYEYRPHFDVLENLQEYICGTNVIITKEALDKVGGYDSAFKTIEDYHMSIKISRYFFGHHIPRPHYMYRQYSGQKTIQALQNDKAGLSNEYKMLHDFKKKLFGIT